jgi:riboflavin transporter FmnP
VAAKIKLPKDIYTIIIATLMGTVLRIIVMSIVNAVCLPLPPPVGFGIPSDVALGFLPVIGIFNGSIVLYTVPIAFVLAEAIRKRVGFSLNAETSEKSHQ